MVDINNISKNLTNRFGLEITGEGRSLPDGELLLFYPIEIPKTIGFKIEIHLGWRTITGKFVPGSFASELISQMNKATLDQKSAFSIFAQSLITKGAEISMKLGSEKVNPEEYLTWPDQWGTIEILMKKVGIILEVDGGYDYSTTFNWAASFFGLSLALLPLEEHYIEESEIGSNEGKISYTTIKKYERSRINRAACIEINGLSCKVCNMNFQEQYGLLGEGFIHIHHIVPLSQMQNEYRLNPGKDLVPVCPNCHSMLHKITPPLKVEELQSILCSQFQSKNPI